MKRSSGVPPDKQKAKKKKHAFMTKEEKRSFMRRDPIGFICGVTDDENGTPASGFSLSSDDDTIPDDFSGVFEATEGHLREAVYKSENRRWPLKRWKN